MGYLRCPLDNTVLLIFNEDDVTLQNCEHYHWHGGPDDLNLDENKEDENEEEDEESWNEVLSNYIAKVSVEDLSLIHI